MDMEKLLREAGYVARRPEVLALRAIEAQVSGIRALLLEGPPGAGKSFLAEAYATAKGANFVFALLHSWSDDQELCSGVDVAAAVEGNAAAVRQDGVLAVAARLSQSKLTVLCLDEIDKVQERTENLLLDFLQTGRVPIRPGTHLQARVENLVVMLTSNAQRELGDAFLRRVRRVRMTSLPVEQLDQITQARTGVPLGVVTLASKAARQVAHAEGNDNLSVQELCALTHDVWAVAESAADCREFLAQLAARTSVGAEAARKANVGPLWAEVMKARR